MDRIWQWAWDGYGARYSWMIWGLTFAAMLVVYILWSQLLVASENSNRYLAAAVVTGIAVLVNASVSILPASRRFRRAHQWAAGREVDRMQALTDTYAWARAARARAIWFLPVWTALFTVSVGAVAEARGWRLAQYGVLGAALGIAMALLGMHTSVQGAMRPVRAALAADTVVGDELPRSHPTFAAWLNVAMLGSLFASTVIGAMLGIVWDAAAKFPALLVLIGCVAIGLYWPITVSGIVLPSLRPIRDLASGTERVAAGDYSQRLPVVQDDDLGALAASFNRMQTGLAERRRLQAAFGTYVDPALASRLLEQGDDIFSGERREVTVMFVDIRDFTPFAEANPAEDVVARLNALFEIVVPAVVDAGGHVNKFLGDGALAVFGAPNDIADHADAAVSTAVLIQRLVVERFEGALRIGIGINTGTVIAGTIGGASKLEFTLIGDAVNVAARVEQLTKTTGDAILLTEQCVDALTSPPLGLRDCGSHALKGKSAAVQLFGLASGIAR
ncbi:cyclase [Mycobacterium sp. 852002-51152_SCH6134967]|uniref:adenylate/guanylate cyclase domain-containing protein n=1 Tax=Mycobacterium sp. 852002-51152_SCH6134967 TaxID=1834096 RepID=UPI0007FFC46F|nr:adenylate/guanylate cyclase domain-containing protein [Mycobacterium sp. 852002-51152_SCH6134967]OBF88743.1 cyclase [Mycobacterium sp. 852002-51152_SCH6134967]